MPASSRVVSLQPLLLLLLLLVVMVTLEVAGGMCLTPQAWVTMMLTLVSSRATVYAAAMPQASLAGSSNAFAVPAAISVWKYAEL
jgi:hypothetical protein